jgi:hypothetical protein
VFSEPVTGRPRRDPFPVTPVPLPLPPIPGSRLGPTLDDNNKLFVRPDATDTGLNLRYHVDDPAPARRRHQAFGTTALDLTQSRLVPTALVAETLKV